MTEREFQEMNDFNDELESAMNRITKIVAVFVGIVLVSVAYYLIF